MATLLIIITEIVSSLFFLIIIWKFGVRPFVVEYQRSSILTVEKLLKTESLQYPEFSKQFRTIRAYLRILNYNLQFFSTLSRPLKYSENNPPKIVDEITGNLLIFLKFSKALADCVQIESPVAEKTLLLFSSLTLWHHPFLYFLFMASFEKYPNKKIALLDMLQNFFKLFIKIKSRKLLLEH
jgi:hypothetical protein